jgi:hypothetical protein
LRVSLTAQELYTRADDPALDEPTAHRGKTLSVRARRIPPRPQGGRQHAHDAHRARPNFASCDALRAAG